MKEVWDWLEKRFDRRAKKNTDLIKVKYALPAMWVIILDLCINPFFLPAPSFEASHSLGVHRVPPSHPTDFPTLAHRRGSTSGFCHPAPRIPLILRANLDSFSVYFQRRITLIPGARIRARVITINSIYRWNYNETLKRSPVIQARLEYFSGVILA